MNIKKKRVLVGLVDIAGQINLFAEGFKANGHEVTTFVRALSPNFADDSFDIIIKKYKINSYISNIIYKLFCIIKYLLIVPIVIIKHDIFLFQAGITFFHGLDLPILRFLNKKIIIIHNGSDVRWWPAFHQMLLFQNYRYSYCPSLNDLSEKRLKEILLTIRRSEVYSDLIISSKDANIMGIKKCMKLFPPIITDNYTYNIPNNKIPIILHSPSFPLAKSTVLIRDVICKLKKDGYEIIYEELANISHEEVKNKLSISDILIEQMGQIINGKNALEGLASGCLVFSDLDPIILDQYEESPIVKTRINDLYLKLKLYLDNRQLWNQHLESSIPYLNKFHDPILITKIIINSIYSINDNGDLMYRPNFLIKKYYPFDNKSTILINKYTKMIKNCNWYRYNSSYNRDGLEF